MVNQKLIHAFERNSAEVVRVHLQRWGKGDYCDIRIWAALEAGGKAGEVPTKKGLTLSVDLLPQLRLAIDKVLAEVEVEREPVEDEFSHENSEKS